MISFHFNIRNPWSHKFVNLWTKAYNTPFKNKFIELQMYKDSSILFISFNLSTRQSHAGLHVEAGLLGYCFDFNFYDSRHWNTIEDRWEVVDD